MKNMAVKKNADRKKQYSLSEIRESIAYWKGRLASLNEAEADDEAIDDDVVDKGDEAGAPPSEDKVKDKAVSSPVGVFNPTKRFYRIHLHAEKVVKKKLAKLLNNAKVPGESVIIENSAVEDGEFHMDQDNILITIKVRVDKAKVKGFRKFVALLKEEDIANMEKLDEGYFKEIFSAIGKVTKEKIDDANEKLKERIGVTAMQEYFSAFFGMILAKKITPNNVYAGVNEGDGAAEFVYCSSVTFKHG